MSDDEQNEHCSPANAELENRSLLAAIADDLRKSWKVLFLTDVTYKLIAFVVLTPVIGILFRGLLAASGNSILTDQDILLFFLGPIGWVCIVAIGALWLAIIALEQAALLGIVAAATQQRQMRVVPALKYVSDIHAGGQHEKRLETNLHCWMREVKDLTTILANESGSSLRAAHPFSKCEGGNSS